MKHLIQILTVAFGLSMLTAYVVYSQLQQNPAAGPARRGGEGPPTSTGQVNHGTNRLVAYGSKSPAPLIAAPASAPAFDLRTSPATATVHPSPMVAPGSKSMIIPPMRNPIQALAPPPTAKVPGELPSARAPQSYPAYPTYPANRAYPVPSKTSDSNQVQRVLSSPSSPPVETAPVTRKSVAR